MLIEPLKSMSTTLAAVENNVGKLQDGGACLLHSEVFSEVYRIEIN